MGRRPFSCVPLKHRQEFSRHACIRRHQQPHMQPHSHTTACVSRETQATFTRNGKAATTQRQSQRNRTRHNLRRNHITIAAITSVWQQASPANISQPAPLRNQEALSHPHQDGRTAPSLPACNPSRPAIERY